MKGLKNQSYSYRHWDGKSYQHVDTAQTLKQKNEMLAKYRRKYRLVRAVGIDTYHGKPDKWGIYAQIGSMKI